jgi:photosystem II stability/assembly factor-like uncharacterized protein
LPTGVRTTSVDCPTASDCWAVGNNTIVASTDGGVSWTTEAVEPSSTLFSGVACPTTATCYAVGSTSIGNPPVDSGLVEATNDGGVNWTTQILPSGVTRLRSLSCAARAYCQAVGVDPTGTSIVVSTSTAGATWNPQHLPPYIESVSAAACPIVHGCWAAGGTAGDIDVLSTFSAP